MTLPFNANQVNNQTHNAPSQPGVDYFLNGGLYAFDTAGLPTITAGKPILAGLIILSARPTVPLGWLACNGGTLANADYPDLHAAIGTTFGGNTTNNTFNLPNLSNLATGVSYIIKV